jgi:hypothetical protein
MRFSPPEVLHQLWKCLVDDDDQQFAELSRLHQMRTHSHNPVEQPYESDSLENSVNKSHHLQLIAYVRQGHEKSVEDQEKCIREYCREHGHKLIDTVVCKINCPNALAEAVAKLNRADGIIISDLLRLFDHENDPVREILSVIHEHFFLREKHLISVEANLDSQSIAGQFQLVKFLKEVSDASRRPSEGLLKMQNEKM